MAPGGGAHAIWSSPHFLGGGQGAFLIAGGPAGHSAALGIQIGGIMQPSAFVTGGQGTMASGGGGVGHQLAQVTPSFSYVDGMHMGGGGQAPASAAASMAPGGGAHAISLSPQVTGGGQGAFLIAGGPAGHSSRLGIQSGGIMQPSAFVTGGQGTMASGGGGIGH